MLFSKKLFWFKKSEEIPIVNVENVLFISGSQNLLLLFTEL